MGVDVEYVRCSEAQIALAQQDRDLALALSGGVGAVATFDIARGHFRVLDALRRLDTDPADDWAERALEGDHFLYWPAGAHAPGIDTGYGTPRFLRVAEVRAIAARLEPITSEVFAGLCEPDDVEHLRAKYADLRAFYLDAARAGDAMVITLC